MKRIFGRVEFVFDLLYLSSASIMGLIMFLRSNQDTRMLIAAFMTMVLVFGDMFHLIPRMKIIINQNKISDTKSLGIGKQVTSITMSLFYLLFWYLEIILFEIDNILLSIVIIVLTIIRIVFCLVPQNQWTIKNPPLKWSIIRNIPFVLQGLMVTILFYIYRNSFLNLKNLYLAVIISFVFYIPVVLWANKKPAIGMLMLPKTLAYIWIIILLMNL